MVRVQVPASPSYRGAPATIWIALYDNERVTEVNTGENSGRGMRDRNVVRMLTPVGTWQGAEVDLTLSLEAPGKSDHDGYGVLVQAAGQGPILGVGASDFDAEAAGKGFAHAPRERRRVGQGLAFHDAGLIQDQPGGV